MLNDALVNMYGSEDFSDVDAISIKSTNTISLTKLSWFGKSIQEDTETDTDTDTEDEIAIVNGYYYVNGEIAKSVGVVEIDGDYYYIGMRGQIFKGSVYVTEEKANGLIETGKYTFDANGLVG